MYIGHYGLAFILKRKFKQIPLWLLFISVQFSDFLTFFLVLLGIEKIYSIEHTNPFYRLVLEYIPYSHSLITNIVISLLILIVFWKLKNKIWGVVLSLSALSHWFLDLPFQKLNLPLFFNKFKVGFSLWDYPLFCFSLETIIIALTGYYLLKAKNIRQNGTILSILILVMFGFFTFITFVTPPPAAQQIPSIKIIIILSAYIIFTVLAFLIEKRKLKNNSDSQQQIAS